MSLLRATGRPMLASMFVAGGLDSLRNPEAVAPVADPVVQPVTARVDALPDSTVRAVRLSGAVQVAAGVLLARLALDVAGLGQPVDQARDARLCDQPPPLEV